MVLPWIGRDVKEHSKIFFSGQGNPWLIGMEILKEEEEMSRIKLQFFPLVAVSFLWLCIIFGGKLHSFKAKLCQAPRNTIISIVTDS